MGFPPYNAKLLSKRTVPALIAMNWKHQAHLSLPTWDMIIFNIVI